MSPSPLKGEGWGGGVMAQAFDVLFTPILSFPHEGGRDALFWYLFRNSFRWFSSVFGISIN